MCIYKKTCVPFLENYSSNFLAVFRILTTLKNLKNLKTKENRKIKVDNI